MLSAMALLRRPVRIGCEMKVVMSDGFVDAFRLNTLKGLSLFEIETVG